MQPLQMTYWGHACFSLLYDGWQIVLDPYEAGSVPGLRALQLRASAVYCSHAHRDHSAASAVSIVQSGGAERYLAAAFLLPHDAENGARRGFSMVRVFDFDGYRLAHLGDIGRIPTREEQLRLGQIDCLLLPVGGYYTIDAGQAAETVAMLAPRLVIPMHYRSECSGFPELAPVSDFLADLSEKTLVQQGGTSVTLTKRNPRGVLIMKAKNEGEKTDGNL